MYLLSWEVSCEQNIHKQTYGIRFLENIDNAWTHTCLYICVCERERWLLRKKFHILYFCKGLKWVEIWQFMHSWANTTPLEANDTSVLLNFFSAWNTKWELYRCGDTFRYRINTETSLLHIEYYHPQRGVGSIVHTDFSCTQWQRREALDGCGYTFSLYCFYAYFVRHHAANIRQPAFAW